MGDARPGSHLAAPGPARSWGSAARRSGGFARRAGRRAPADVADEIELAVEYGRYGCRRVAALLRSEGFAVNHKRVERLWRREGLKGAREAAKAGPPVAERRLVRPAAARAEGPRLELRFRAGPHPGWQGVPGC